MKILTLADVRAWNPCKGSDPLKWVEEDWTGTILDILKSEYVPASSRLWCALREDFMTKDQIESFKSSKFDPKDASTWIDQLMIELVKNDSELVPVRKDYSPPEKFLSDPIEAKQIDASKPIPIDLKDTFPIDTIVAISVDVINV